MTKRRKHYLPVFDVGLEVIVTESILPVRNTKSMVKRLNGEYHQQSKALWSYRNRDCILFFTKKYLGTGIVAHEAFHAASDIMEINGIEASTGAGNETGALLCEHLVKLVLKDIKSWKIKLKP